MESAPLPPLLFVASDRREAEPWVAHWQQSRPIKLPVHWAQAGTWKGREVIAIANGVGTNRAASAIQAARAFAGSFSGIVSIGTAGALDSSLNIGDIVVATALEGFSGSVADPGCPQNPLVRTGLVHSSPHIARTAEEKRKLNASGAIIVEMEAAGVANAAQELAVPFFCVKVVSDLAEESFALDFESFIMPDGRFNVASLAMQAMAHPFKALPELLRLQKRTAEASKNLAAFLSNCEFPI